MKNLIQAAVVTLLAASTAHAQQAVQWKVSDGGNGHWYKLVLAADPVTWQDGQAFSAREGAHLATITTHVENLFLASYIQSNITVPWGAGISPEGCWLGGRKIGGAWTWSTGEPWDFTGWNQTQCIVGGGNQPDSDGVPMLLQIACLSGGECRWDDICNSSEASSCTRPFVLLEWSADCNHDGIVDYGQCHDGTLPDYNGNNIPDSCEVPTGWVVVADSVAEYTTTQGANGWHYLYDTGAGTSVVPMAYVVTSEFPPFMPAWCTHPAFGGNGSYCSIDQIQCHTSTPSHCSSASAGLERPHRRWINSSAVKGTVLISGYFGATAGFTTRLQVFADGQLVFEQVASPAATPGNTTPIGAVVNLPPTSVLDVVVDPNDGSCHADRVEYSVRVIGADCNGDGIVDYGQVMTGQLADLNGNTVPDICEGPNCHDADLYPNNRIDGADLGILLSEWGPVNPSTNSDINHDSFVNGADLGILLSFWGACQN